MADRSALVQMTLNDLESMGSAADFKVGVQNRIRERIFCTPTFPNVGYKQTNISRGYGASKHVIDIQSDQNSQFVIGIRIKWRRRVEL